ncbi:WXG100 family type VII secretion target [Amycolatopsis benzoatilytica]|uniref:WXG100 family type VII secretion target n=1 Tax=Amycolatopsis benzoatilytica TaxID=346045 RepID=UPI0003A8B3E8|nr:hypothetical protein [Amycolatopsis benzoatilytica]
MTDFKWVDTSNPTAGTGVADSWNGFAGAIDSLKNAHGADTAAVAVEIGVTLVGAVIDTVAFVLDPIGKLAAAGVGWLIEHIGPLKEALDAFAGDPTAIKQLADNLHKTGETLRQAGQDLEASYKAQITQWAGTTADKFKNEIDTRITQINDSGKAVDTAGYVVETTMALVSVTRSLVRDIISTVLGDIIAVALVALAAAVWTFGASLVAGVATIVGKVAVTVADVIAKIAKIVALAGRTLGRLKDLGKMSKPLPNKPGSDIEMHPPGSHPTPTPTPPPSPRPSSESGGAGVGGSGTHAPPGEHPPVPPPAERPPSPNGEHPPGSQTPHEDGPNPNQHLDDWKTWDEHFNPPPKEPTPPPREPTPPPHEPTPPPNDHTSTSSTPDPSRPNTPDPAAQRPPGGETPPASTPPAKVSPLEQYKIEWMKHDDWLKKNYTENQAKAKFMENWLKNDPKYNEYFPLIKGISDAKSTKNWVGWVTKDAITVDKAMTDIHMRAEEAWNQSAEDWRKNHPDPAQGA